MQFTYKIYKNKAFGDKPTEVNLTKMKKLFILSLMSFILSFAIPQKTIAQSNFSKNDSLVLKDIFVYFEYVHEFVGLQSNLEKQLKNDQIAENFPTQFKKINQLNKKSLDLMYKAGKKEAGSEKHLYCVQEAFKNLLFAQLMYNELINT
ncbi:MAG: hypothetical protein B6229_02800 [Spirochaetaceae bacterium 4572_7]|nr:MAG: hypothetical protein B6229_02800 [Spirochaetaceae bacterium 4572_7]